MYSFAPPHLFHDIYEMRKRWDKIRGTQTHVCLIKMSALYHLFQLVPNLPNILNPLVNDFATIELHIFEASGFLIAKLAFHAVSPINCNSTPAESKPLLSLLFNLIQLSNLVEVRSNSCCRNALVWNPWNLFDISCTLMDVFKTSVNINSDFFRGFSIPTCVGKKSS